MTCRHSLGDPSCSSTAGGYADMQRQRERDEERQRERAKEQADIYARTPDVDKYEVEETERVGAHLVLKVRYPNCSKCAYEGSKVMVFLNVTEAAALRWRRIDPHFRDPLNTRKPSEAPPPAARFPGSREGWCDAVTYARGKSSLPIGEGRDG